MIHVTGAEFVLLLMQSRLATGSAVTNTSPEGTMHLFEQHDIDSSVSTSSAVDDLSDLESIQSMGSVAVPGDTGRGNYDDDDGGYVDDDYDDDDGIQPTVDSTVLRMSVLPGALRDGTMQYPADAPFICEEEQYTNVRGYIEPWVHYQRALDVQELEKMRELFGSSDVDYNETHGSDIVSQRGGDGAGAGRVAALDRQRPTTAAPPMFPAPTLDLPPPLRDQRPQPLPDALAGLASHMLNDMSTVQTTYLTAPLPKHVEERQKQRERFRRDGITDLAIATKDCPICKFALEARFRNEINTVLAGFNAIVQTITFYNIEERAPKACTYWQVHLHKPFNSIGKDNVPAITPSHVEVHWFNCKEVSTARIGYNLKLLHECKEVLVQNQLFAREHVAGVPTKRTRTTLDGWGILKQVFAEEREQARLYIGAKMAEEREGRTELDPLYNSRMREASRSVLLREFDQERSGARDGGRSRAGARSGRR